MLGARLDEDGGRDRGGGVGVRVALEEVEHPEGFDHRRMRSASRHEEHRRCSAAPGVGCAPCARYHGAEAEPIHLGYAVARVAGEPGRH
jgi:hypothetical protein